jgi:hypothetical protein
VEGELAIVERNQAKKRDKGENGGSGDANARTLASLARTLSVLRGLEAEAENASQDSDADAPPLDLAELRHELARRLDRLRRARDAS